MEKIVIDGRNPHAVPRCVSRKNFGYRIVISEWDTKLCEPLHKDETVYCWFIDDKYCPVVYYTAEACYYICAEYKTYTGFCKWLEKFYPQAYLVKGR